MAIKRFKFRLEKVLQYREVVRSECRRELIQALARLHDAQENLTKLQIALEKNILDSKQVNAELLFLSQQFAVRLREDIASQREQILLLERFVEEAREAYIEASKDAEALKLLKKKQQARHQEHIRKEEEKAIDEMNIQRERFRVER
ncbi:MAG: flagellar export protein FliJ [Bdellovibrionales bacterium]|nr:flagellar export protein FliJ [Bdellovibrionales bacterium]